MPLRCNCFIDEVSFWQNAKLWSWDYCPQVPDYRDFWITRYRINGVLLYIIGNFNSFMVQGLKWKCNVNMRWKHNDIMQNKYLGPVSVCI
jgi:hypothetical protein